MGCRLWGRTESDLAAAAVAVHQLIGVRWPKMREERFQGKFRGITAEWLDQRQWSR